MILEPKADNLGKAPLSSETAIALLKKIQNGNLSALMTLYDKTSPLLLGLLMRVLGDRAAAEAALLDVYTQVWKQSGSHETGGAPLYWLVTLAHSNAVARLHWEKRDAVKQGAAQRERISDMTVAPDMQKLARSVMETIPSIQRELLEEAYYRGLCSSEIAARLGKPAGAVRALLRLGLSRIGESFGTGTGG